MQILGRDKGCFGGSAIIDYVLMNVLFCPLVFNKNRLNSKYTFLMQVVGTVNCEPCSSCLCLCLNYFCVMHPNFFPRAHEENCPLFVSFKKSTLPTLINANWYRFRTYEWLSGANLNSGKARRHEKFTPKTPCIN